MPACHADNLSGLSVDDLEISRGRIPEESFLLLRHVEFKSPSCFCLRGNMPTDWRRWADEVISRWVSVCVVDHGVEVFELDFQKLKRHDESRSNLARNKSSFWGITPEGIFGGRTGIYRGRVIHLKNVFKAVPSRPIPQCLLVSYFRTNQTGQFLSLCEYRTQGQSEGRVRLSVFGVLDTQL
jgi:hypothetical protein